MSDAITQGHEAAEKDRQTTDFLYKLPTHLFAPDVYTLEMFPRMLLPRGVDPISVNCRQDEVPTTEIDSFMQGLRNEEPHTWGRFLAHLAGEIRPDWEAFNFVRETSPFGSIFITTVFRCTDGSLHIRHWDQDNWLRRMLSKGNKVERLPESMIISVNFD